MNYRQKLLDPRWQKKRLQVLEKSKWQCEICFDDEKTLHVHHKMYFTGRDPWEYDDDQLAVLCESCHELHHSKNDLMLEVVSRLPLDGKGCREDAAYLLAGFAGIKLSIDFERSQALFEVGEASQSAVFSKWMQIARKNQEAEDGQSKISDKKPIAKLSAFKPKRGKLASSCS
jgi:hypothetical protein